MEVDDTEQRVVELPSDNDDDDDGFQTTLDKETMELIDRTFTPFGELTHNINYHLISDSEQFVTLARIKYIRGQETKRRPALDDKADEAIQKQIDVQDIRAFNQFVCGTSRKTTLDDPSWKQVIYSNNRGEKLSHQRNVVSSSSSSSSSSSNNNNDDAAAANPFSISSHYELTRPIELWVAQDALACAKIAKENNHQTLLSNPLSDLALTKAKLPELIPRAFMEKYLSHTIVPSRYKNNNSVASTHDKPCLKGVNCVAMLDILGGGVVKNPLISLFLPSEHIGDKPVPQRCCILCSRLNQSTQAIAAMQAFGNIPGITIAVPIYFEAVGIENEYSLSASLFSTPTTNIGFNHPVLAYSASHYDVISSGEVDQRITQDNLRMPTKRAALKIQYF